MVETQTVNIKTKKIKLDFKDSKYSTGRRKRSIAKVWVKKGSGIIHVNGKKMNEYFKSMALYYHACLYFHFATLELSSQCFRFQ